MPHWRQASPAAACAPRDRDTEDGTLSQHPLEPLPNAGYRERTLKNGQESDGAAIFLSKEDFCKRESKPWRAIDASLTSLNNAVDLLMDFIGQHAIAALNVAGPVRAVGAGDMPMSLP